VRKDGQKASKDANFCQFLQKRYAFLLKTRSFFVELMQFSVIFCNFLQFFAQILQENSMWSAAGLSEKAWA